MVYTEAELMRVARRLNNSRRSYILVNPLQGKHHPSRPEAALEMMGALGDAVSAHIRPGRSSLVIGFAETATAIGAVVAEALGPGTHYITTTREDLPDVREWLHFQEEHSHAVEQKLCADDLGARLRAGTSIVIVDDELTTGKTLRNLVAGLRARYPELAEQRFLAASLINRLSEENRARLAGEGIDCVCLLRMPEAELDSAVSAFEIEQSEDVRGRDELPKARLECLPLPNEAVTAPEGSVNDLPDVRRGTDATRYARECAALAERLAAAEELRALAGRRVQVLGTEEFMYPALLLARELSRFADVRVHATTRSPIGICTAPGYPITSGCLLRSCYAPERRTYVYDLAPCDATVVFTDAPRPRSGLDDLARAVRRHGCGRLLALQAFTTKK